MRDNLSVYCIITVGQELYVIIWDKKNGKYIATIEYDIN